MPGVSTRRVDDLVRTLGIASISKSEVSGICAPLDAEVSAKKAATAELADVVEEAKSTLTELVGIAPRAAAEIRTAGATSGPSRWC